MRMCTCGRHTMVAETTKEPIFELVSFIARFILVNKPTHRCNFFYWQACFRWVKEANEITILQACCFKHVCLNMHCFCYIGN